jgi:peptidoglycan L-alanyl-D-glutamate endopeptidase CwlK
MTYQLGARSVAKLRGVHPMLVAVVNRAIELTEQDFSVVDGLRSAAQQAELVRRGASQTLASRHLAQPDGWGHAVDLVPYHDGAPRWEWPLIYPVAAAAHKAARQLGVALRWGGVWDRRLELLPGTPLGLQEAVLAYARRHPGPDFLDGPHYELVS